VLRRLRSRPSGSPRRHARIGIVTAVVVVGSGLGAWVASPLYNLSAEGLGRSSSAESWSRVASTQCFGTDAPADGRKGLGWLAVLAIPVACCGGPLLVVALAAAGAAAWGGLGAVAAVAVAVTLPVVALAAAGAAAWGGLGAVAAVAVAVTLPVVVRRRRAGA
jgi:hypothetical protein